MKRDRLAVYLHLVWATWDRLPNIAPEIERRLYRNIESQAQEILAINGMPDHVHLLVKLPPTVTIAGLVKQVKGISSRFVNETIQPGFLFRWQGRYGAFSVSRWDVDRIVNYVRRQKEHHGDAEVLPELEEMDEEVPATRQA